MLRYLPVLFGAIGFPATLVLADATNGPSAAVTLRRLLSSGGTVFAATVDDFSSGAECTPYRIVPSSKGRGPYIVTKETKTAREGHDLALVVWPEGKAPLGQCNVQLIFLGSWSEDKRNLPTTLRQKAAAI